MISVVLKGVNHWLGRRQVLSDINVEFFEGEVIGVIGSGGKSLLLRLIAGLERPSSGSVEVLGCDPYRERRALRRLLSYLPQTIYMPSGLKLKEFFLFVGRLNGLSDGELRGSIKSIAEEFGVSNLLNTTISELGSSTKRLAAALAVMMHRPRLIVLDEPLSGLGVAYRTRLLQYVQQLARDNRTIVMAVSDTSIASFIDRLVIIVNGKLHAVGGVQDIARRLGGEDYIVLNVMNVKRTMEIASRMPYVRKISVGKGGLLKIWLKSFERDLWPVIEALYGMDVGIRSFSIASIDLCNSLADSVKRIEEGRG